MHTHIHMYIPLCSYIREPVRICYKLFMFLLDYLHVIHKYVCMRTHVCVIVRQARLSIHMRSLLNCHHTR